MSGSGVIGMHEPWVGDDGIEVVAPRPGGFVARHRGDVVLMASMLGTAVGAGLAARVLCGV